MKENKNKVLVFSKIFVFGFLFFTIFSNTQAQQAGVIVGNVGGGANGSISGTVSGGGGGGSGGGGVVIGSGGGGGSGGGVVTSPSGGSGGGNGGEVLGVSTGVENGEFPGMPNTVDNSYPNIFNIILLFVMGIFFIETSILAFRKMKLNYNGVSSK